MEKDYKTMEVLKDFEGNPVMKDGKPVMFLPTSKKVRWFRDENPKGRFVSERIPQPNPYCIVYKVDIYFDVNDANPGISWEYQLTAWDDASYDKCAVKCQTIALGKALSLLGYGCQIEDGADELSAPEAPEAPKKKARKKAEKKVEKTEEEIKEKEEAMEEIYAFLDETSKPAEEPATASEPAPSSEPSPASEPAAEPVTEADPSWGDSMPLPEESEPMPDETEEEPSEPEEDEMSLKEENALNTVLIASEDAKSSIMMLDGMSLREILKDRPTMYNILIRPAVAKQINPEMVEAAKVIASLRG